ncbi:inclusion-associated protein [Chlamydia suis]|uniref:inclusion-associated protein n=1 Tax=Chlamydia suis TaxID=83559 RepID=UPI0009B0C04C|nr:inclusion-associated protein [Chlamydia suis]
MPSSHYFPFFCAAIIIHIALGGALLLSSPQTPKPKLRSFKERIVSFPVDPKITCQTPVVVSPTAQPAQAAQPSPTPKPKVPPSEKKHPTKPPETTSSSKPSQAPTSSKPSQASQEKKLATLKKLAQLANQLAKDAEAQESHITQLSLPMQVQVSAESAYQQEAFCALFQQYVCLPFPGEIRLKLEFSKEGALVQCSILSSISPTDKQRLLSQIQKIPFQSFFNTYKPSKNITFHIRLQGSSA